MFGWAHEVDEERVISHKMEHMMRTVLLFAGMAGLLALLGWMLAGEKGIWWSLILALVINMMVPAIAPSLILRLSGARWIDPRRRPDLYQMVVDLARRANLEQIPHLYYIPSATPNAVAVGSGSGAAVAISDGLLNLLNGRELTCWKRIRSPHHHEKRCGAPRCSTWACGFAEYGGTDGYFLKQLGKGTGGKEKIHLACIRNLRMES